MQKKNIKRPKEKSVELSTLKELSRSTKYFKKGNKSAVFLSVGVAGNAAPFEVTKQDAVLLKSVARLAKKCTLYVEVEVQPGVFLPSALSQLLIKIVPYAKMVRVAPARLTKQKEVHSPFYVQLSKDVSLQIIDIVRIIQESCQKWFGERKVFAADVCYVSAGLPQPPFEVEMHGFYELSQFEAEFQSALKAQDMRLGSREVTVVVGKISASCVKRLSECLQERCKRVKVSVQFVDSFSVYGMLTDVVSGKDVIKALGGKLQTKRVIVFSDAIKCEQQSFVDGTTLGEVEKALGVKIDVVPKNGNAFLAAVVQKEK